MMFVFISHVSLMQLNTNIINVYRSILGERNYFFHAFMRGK